MGIQLNFTGPVAALAAFFSIWAGHVAVRKIEAASSSLVVPMVVAVMAGLGLGFASLGVPAAPAKASLGVASVLLLWDAFEFLRQEGRVRRGHAAANPENPRHARILAESGSRATRLDPLERAAP
jgi:hypothetical protein